MLWQQLLMSKNMSGHTITALYNFMYLIRDMQETSSDVLQLVKDENTVQKLNFLSYDIKN
jgi:hypothetical protein